jgi:sensor histidine kinase regulating citrate/malate metabolism
LIGLGLFIVKKTVERLKGEIKVTSKLNKGTTFMIQRPKKYKNEAKENNVD